jgi:hypothetical protein
MPSNLTLAGATAAMTAVLGPFFVGLGTGQNATGLVGEAVGGGYGRVPVTLAQSGRNAANGGPITFSGFTQTQGAFTHAGLFTAATGGTCIWVGPLDAAVNITAGGTITIQAGDLALEVVAAA